MKMIAEINFEVIIKKRKTYRDGSSCFFVPLDDKVALKVYFNEFLRDRAYKNQILLSEYDLAPIAYDKGEFVHDNSIYYYYMTEIVDTVDTYYKVEDAYKYNFLNLSKLEHECPGCLQKIKEETEKLRQKIEFLNIGYKFIDRWEGNVGYKNSQMVVIDTE